MIVEEPKQKSNESDKNYHSPKIKDMDRADTPRERAEKHGCHSLSTADLWALVLRTGLPGKPITQLCRELMSANDNSLSVLERRDRSELLAIKGLGPLKVTQIQAVMELIRRYNIESAPSNPIIRSSNDIYSLLAPRLANLPHEEIWIMLLNRANKVIKMSCISSGGISASVFDVKMIVKMAILENASGIVLAHNHPSGNCKSSTQDDNITRALAQACSTMDIKFIDHLILTRDSYLSYHDESKI